MAQKSGRIAPLAWLLGLGACTSVLVLQFFEQALQNGAEAATRESYVSLPTRAEPRG